MTFSDMTPAGRDQVLAWARDHDWGQYAAMHRLDSGFALRFCECDVFHADGTRETERPTFSDLATLRAWAGY